MDQNNNLFVLSERASMWTKGFPPITLKINLWTNLDQLPLFWNFVEYISLASCLSTSSLISLL